ncbi:linear gramicidin synthetase subunit D [Streptomyces sp. HCCB10043]|nr:linear gramicidin synthetase subunit D [Streptomyces sp. HCCB10043]
MLAADRSDARAVPVGDRTPRLFRDRRVDLGFVEAELWDVAPRQFTGRTGVGEDHGRPAVVEDDGGALGGVGEVERDVGGSGLEDREKCHQQLGGPGQGDGDETFGTDAVGGDQVAGEPVGPGVQVGVGEDVVVLDDGRPVGGPRRTAFEEIEHRAWGGGVGGVVPLGEECAFVVAEEFVRTDGAVRCSGGLLQDGEVALDQALRGDPREEIGAELESAVDAEAVRVLGEEERQVELGHAGVDGMDAAGEAREAGPVGGVVRRRAVVRDHDLEERVPGQGPLRFEYVDETLEGNVLVGVRVQVGGPHPRHEFRERRVPGDVVAQYERVDEEPDEVFRAVVGAARDGCSEGDVVARAVPRQQGGERGLHDHEHGDAVGLGHGPQRVVRVLGHGEGDRLAPAGGNGGPGVVGGQFELLGQAGQGVAPVVELCAVRRIVQQVPSAQGVVGVLQGQRLEVRGVAGAAGAVGVGEIAYEDLDGGSVAGGVVDEEQQGVVVRAAAEQVGFEWDLTGEVEGAACGFGEGCGEIAGRDGAVGQFGAGGLGGQDDLVGAFGVLGEESTQGLVAVGDVLQGDSEGRDVERAFEPDGGGDVVRGAGAFDLVEEPQSLLRVRQGEALRARRQRRGGVLPSVVVQEREKAGDGGEGEQVAEGEVGAELGPDPGEQPGAVEGVAAELEEHVVRGDLRYAEDVGEQGAECLLLWGDRALPGSAGAGGGDGKGRPVQFAVGRQRQCGEGDERPGHHVGREGTGQGRTELTGVRFGAGRGHDVPDEPGVPGAVLADQDAGLTYPGESGERGLDLAEFDAEAAEFDLSVGSSDEFQHAAGAPPHQVTGAVHAAAGRAERVGDETLGGGPGSSDVAPGEALAGQVQFAGRPVGDGFERRVEDVAAPVEGGAAERDGAVGGTVTVPGGRLDGCLGGPVRVDDVPAPAPLVEDLRRADLSADDQSPQVREICGGHGGECAGGEGCGGDGLRGKEVGEVTAGQAVRRYHQAAAGQEGHAQFGDEDVEPRGDELQYAGVRSRAVAPDLVGGEGGQPFVSDDDTLRPSGGAGGLDDVRRVAGCRAARGGLWAALTEEVGGGQLRRGVGQAVDVSGGDEVPGSGVVEYTGQPLGRMGGVQRHVGGAGPLDAEQDRDALGGLGEGEGDDVLGTQAEAGQPSGRPFDTPVQVAVGEDGAVVLDGGRVGGAPGLFGEEFRQGGTRYGAFRAAGVVEQPGAGARRQEAVSSGRQVRVGGHSVEEAQEPLLVVGQIGGRVQGGVTAEDQLDAVGGAGGAVGVDVEVADRSRGQLVDHGPAVAEPDVVDIRQDVDGDPRQARGAADAPQVPVEFFPAEPLVARQRADGAGGVGKERGERGIEPGVEAQRHVVGEHARGTQRRPGEPGGDGQADDGVVGGSVAAYERGGGGDEQ